MSSKQERLLDLLEQWCEANERGKPLSVECLCADCPDLVDDLHRHVAMHQQMERLAEPISMPQRLTDPHSPAPTTVPDGPGQAPPEDIATPGRPDWPAVLGYEVLSELGEGGMGVVYKARQVGLQRLVALKMLKPASGAGEEELQRLRSEARSLARLQHPHIVQVFDIGEHNGQPYFSLEFCAGGSLDRRLQRTPQPPRETAALLETLAKAIQAAHEANVIHRDLKPANVLLTSEGQPKVTDFGLARKLDDVSQTQHGAVLGTPSYMAPEQAQGLSSKIGPAADVYALGAILYECLTGRPPFCGPTVFDTLLQTIHDDPVPPSRLNPTCPRDLETICLKCLQKQPAARYVSARHMADDLRRYLDGKPILARPAGRLERVLKWARRSPAQAAAVGAGLMCVLALVAVFYAQARSARLDAGVVRQQAELDQRELEEQRRLDSIREEFTRLYSQAEQKAGPARSDDVETWAGIERDLRAALALVGGEPELKDFPLVASAQRLLGRAENFRVDAKQRAEQRLRLERLRAYHGNAVFFGTLYTGLELLESLDRTRQAAATGLALYGVKVGGDGPPVVDGRFLKPEEVALVTACCYELLLLDAEALSLPLPGEAKQEHQARLRQALRLLERADRLLGGQPARSGLVRKANYLNQLGQEKAARAVEQQVERTPVRLAADHFFTALEHYEQNELTAARESLVEALRLQPGHSGAEYVLAVCLMQQRRFSEARARLNTCLEQRRDFAWARLLRGHAEMELGRFAAAQADYDAVLRNPPDPSARYVALVNRGVLALRQRHWDDAVALLKEAIDSNREALPAYINLALTYRESVEPAGWEGAGLCLSGGGLLLAGREVQRQQAWRQAVAVLDEAIRRQARVARLYHERAQLYLRLGQHERAGQDLARAITLDVGRGPASIKVEALLALGRLLHRSGKDAEAVEAFATVKKLQPGEVLADRLMAEPLLALGRYREAGEALDRFLAATEAGPVKLPPGQQVVLLVHGKRNRTSIGGRG